MAYLTDGTIGANMTSSDTTARFALGTRVVSTDGQVLVYITATAAIAQYDFVGIDEDFSASGVTKAIADAGWRIGVCQYAIASGEYGFAVVQGANVLGNLLTLCAADKSLFTCATTGALDDGSASQTEILGISAITTVVTGSGTEVVLTFPLVNLANS